MWPAKCRQACLRVGRPRNSVGEPDAANPPVRFDEREVETEHGKASEAPATERAGNCWALPNPPRHFPTLLIFRDISEPTNAMTLRQASLGREEEM